MQLHDDMDIDQFENFHSHNTAALNQLWIPPYSICLEHEKPDSALTMAPSDPDFNWLMQIRNNADFVLGHYMSA